MFTSYYITDALVADRQRTLRQDARNHRLGRRQRGERRWPHRAHDGNRSD